MLNARYFLYILIQTTTISLVMSHSFWLTTNRQYFSLVHRATVVEFHLARVSHCQWLSRAPRDTMRYNIDRQHMRCCTDHRLVESS